MKDKQRSKAEKKKRPTGYEEPLAIKGEFLEVFKVVKKNKEQKAKTGKQDSNS